MGKLIISLLGGVLLHTLMGAAPLLGQLPKVNVRVSVIPIYSVLPLYVGIEKGYFEEKGIKPQVEVLADPRALEAIAGGSIDIGFTAGLSVLVARDRGFDFKIIAGGSYSPYVSDPGARPPYRDNTPLLVLEDSGIASPKQLEGKKVAVNARGSVNWLFAKQWMAQNGADPEKVTWVELPFPNMDMALRKGVVDSIFITDPYASIAKLQGKVRVLDYPFSAVSPGTVLGVWAARSDWLNKHSAIAQAFADALQRGAEFIKANREESLEILVKSTRLSRDLASQMLFSDSWLVWKEQIDVKALQALSDLAFRWGVIKTRLDVSTVTHSSAQ